MFDETSNGIDNRLADTNNSSLSQQNYKLFTKVVRSNSLLTSKRGLQLKRQHSWPQIHPITGVALQNRLLMRSSLSGTSSSLMTDSIAINIDNFRSDNVATHNGNDNSSNQDSTLQNDSSFLAFAQLVRHAAEHFSHSPTTSANYASTASTVLPHHTIDMTVDGRHGDLRVVPSPPSAHTSSINTTGDRNVNESGEDNSRNNGNNSGNNGNNNSIPQLRVLLDSREAIYDRFWQYICQNFTEFPNLHFFNVLVLALIVISIVFTQFFTAEFTACCTLFFGFMHYQDSARFMRCVSGASDVYFTLISVLVRNVLILYVFNKQFIFSVVIFREVVSPMTNPNFFSILYRIIASELFVMDITLLCKLAMSKNPFVSKVYKRRVYQWMEYTSVLYRFPIPLVQWCAFFDSIFCVVVYCIVKLLIALPIAWAWSRTTVRLFRYSHLGTTPTAEELKNAEQCTICYNEFTSPVKFNCGHIFCSDCIRTWLDREVTCPICRAIVTKEDNNYRNGNSIVPMHMF